MVPTAGAGPDYSGDLANGCKNVCSARRSPEIIDLYRRILPVRPASVASSQTVQVAVPRHELGWDAIFQLYDEDRVVEAFEAAGRAGLGPTAAMAPWYRTLEAEATTRRNSIQTTVSSNVQLEYIPTEVPDPTETVLAAVDRAKTILRYSEQHPALITILSEEADAPWATHPGGYASPRIPYIKVCIPYHATKHNEEFFKTVAHEFAHVITMRYTKDEAMRWVEEGVSVYVEYTFDPLDRRDFATGDIEWLDWESLEGEFDLPDDTPEDLDAIWLAYQQSAWVVRYLAETFGEDKLVEFLKCHGDESFWHNVSARLSGLTRTEAAMRRTYEISVEQAFENALEFLQHHQ